MEKSLASGNEQHGQARGAIMNERRPVIEELNESGLLEVLRPEFLVNLALQVMAKRADQTGGRTFSMTPAEAAHVAAVDRTVDEDRRAKRGQRIIDRIAQLGIIEKTEDSSDRYRFTDRQSWPRFHA